MLRKFYDWIIGFADHPHAIWVLSAVSFAESSFFPIPPDPLYVAMLLSNRDKAWTLALICTVTSVLGGLLGYAIGYCLYETLGEWILTAYGLQAAFDKFQDSFNAWGFWIVTLKGLTPIPYKVVTIACGLTGLNIFKFMLASVIARGFRFFMLATLFWYYGPSIKTYIDENLTLVTFVTVGALFAGFGIIYAIG